MADQGAAPLTEAERATIQRRVLWVLASGQVVGAAALATAVTVGAFVIQGILGDKTALGGLATATVTIGTAFTSLWLSRLMRRRGRRPGMQLGYTLASIGGLVAAIGAQHRSLPIFVLGLFVFGNGQASNLLARYAATDLATSEDRSRAMSRVVFASTFGAVLGPLVIAPVERAGQDWFGWWKYTGPWVLGSICFAFAAINVAVRLRPDPLVVAGGVVPYERGGIKAPPVRAALQIVSRHPMARLGLLAMVISQMTMVAVMMMTPVHLKLHHHEGVSAYVISLHIAGMYALAPIVGRYADRRGRLPAIVVGAVVLIGATVLAALSGDVEQLLFPALWALGLGWNFGLIGGSSLLTESVPAADRVSVQGSADLMMSFCGGVAGFSSGFIRKAVGFHALSSFATLAAGLLLVTVWPSFQARRRQLSAAAPASAI